MDELNSMDMLNETEDLSNIITLNDEDGNEIRFEFLDLIEYKGDEYVVLLPMEDDDSEVVILQVVPCSDDAAESYISVEDPAVLQAVFGIFKEKFRDIFNFVD